MRIVVFLSLVCLAASGTISISNITGVDPDAVAELFGVLLRYALVPSDGNLDWHFQVDQIRARAKHISGQAQRVSALTIEEVDELRKLGRDYRRHADTQFNAAQKLLEASQNDVSSTLSRYRETQANYAQTTTTAIETLGPLLELGARLHDRAFMVRAAGLLIGISVGACITACVFLLARRSAREPMDTMS